MKAKSSSGHISGHPKAKLGSGKRFAALEKSIAKNPNVTDPKAVAAAIGRAKYGNKKFQELATKGAARARKKG